MQRAAMGMDGACPAQATVRCLAANGRLLEIGKYDILKGTPLSMRTMIRNISYEGIDLARVANDPDNVDEVTSLTNNVVQSLIQPQDTCQAGACGRSRGSGPADAAYLSCHAPWLQELVRHS